MRESTATATGRHDKRFREASIVLIVITRRGNE